MNKSIQEEILCALWLIAAFEAKQAGIPEWAFWCLIGKACLDGICAISAALKGAKEDSR